MISVSRRLCTMSGRYAGRGRGRGRGGGGGGPPPGLSGKQIGLWYKDRSKGKKKEKEINEVPVRFSQCQRLISVFLAHGFGYKSRY